MDILLIMLMILGGGLVLMLISAPILVKFTNKYDEWECFNKQTELPQAKITYKQLQDFYLVNPNRYFSDDPQHFNRLFVIDENGNKLLHIQLTFKDWNKYIKDLNKFRINKTKQEQLQKEKEDLKLFLSIVQSDIDNIRQKETDEIEQIKSLTEELSKPIKLTLDKKENMNVYLKPDEFVVPKETMMANGQGAIIYLF